MEISHLEQEVLILKEKIKATHNCDSLLVDFLKITEELGEISQLLFMNSTGSRKGKKISNTEVSEALGYEIADMIISLVYLASRFDINLSIALRKKLDIHKDRLKWNKSS